MKQKILVLGAGGFIGGHLVTKLKSQGHYVIGADIKCHEFKQSDADEFYQVDLRITDNVNRLITPDINMIYQLAADMGGAGYIFTGDNDADIMHNSAKININVVEAMVASGVKNVLFTSSACIYPGHHQEAIESLCLTEDSAYPANPDSEYGWEKLFSERLYLSFARNYGFRVRIARLHNVFGPLGTYCGGKEKAPAALCRKVIESTGTIDVWGSGKQIRSFLYIDDCLEGLERIWLSDYDQPLNLGSDRMVTINHLVQIISKIANKEIQINNIPGPQGVNCRTSDNQLIGKILDWQPHDNLEYGLGQLYTWIKSQVALNQGQ